MKPRSNLANETFTENELTPENGMGDETNINILRG